MCNNLRPSSSENREHIYLTICIKGKSFFSIFWFYFHFFSPLLNSWLLGVWFSWRSKLRKRLNDWEKGLISSRFSELFSQVSLVQCQSRIEAIRRSKLFVFQMFEIGMWNGNSSSLIEDTKVNKFQVTSSTGKVDGPFEWKDFLSIKKERKPLYFEISNPSPLLLEFYMFGRAEMEWAFVARTWKRKWKMQYNFYSRQDQFIPYKFYFQHNKILFHWRTGGEGRRTCSNFQ